EDGSIIGYAYASAFHPRRAYIWSAEATVYLKMDERGRGVGRMLYHALEEALQKQNVLNVNACIAYPNPHSIAFHEAMGYHQAGKFTDCAYKLGQWLGMVWMEKSFGEHSDPPAEFIPYPEIEKE
ncbi:MAG: N-acetyltransferase, partial [Anaerotignum sp.]|nr:N-acetyltransferase [Anaerotignum sp.]